MPKGQGYRKKVAYKKKAPKKDLNSKIKTALKAYDKKRVEVKHWFQSLPQASITNATPSMINITDIVQGDGYDQRVGDRIYLKYIKINLLLRNPVSGADAAEFQLFRVMVFQYKTSHPATAPTIAELFIDSAGIGGSAAPGPGSMRNPDYMKTHVALYDRTFKTEFGTPNASNFGQSGQNVIYKSNIVVPLKWCDKEISFISSGTTGVNPIYLMVFAHSNPTVDATVAWDLDLGFTDS